MSCIYLFIHDFVVDFCISNPFMVAFIVALSLHLSRYFCYYVFFNKSTPVRPFNSIATLIEPRQIRPIFPFRMVVTGHTFGRYGCNHSASMAILSLFYV